MFTLISIIVIICGVVLALVSLPLLKKFDNEEDMKKLEKVEVLEGIGQVIVAVGFWCLVVSFRFLGN